MKLKLKFQFLVEEFWRILCFTSGNLNFLWASLEKLSDKGINRKFCLKDKLFLASVSWDRDRKEKISSSYALSWSIENLLRNLWLPQTLLLHDTTDSSALPIWREKLNLPANLRQFWHQQVVDQFASFYFFDLLCLIWLEIDHKLYWIWRLRREWNIFNLLMYIIKAKMGTYAICLRDMHKRISRCWRW